MKLIHGDCLEYLRGMKEKVTLIFADPPDNIGLSYDGYNDNRNDYIGWLHEIISLSLTKCDIFWLSYNAIWDFPIHDIIHKQRWKAKKILWRYTFSQYNDKDFAIGYRPMFALFSPEAVTYPMQILVPSTRTEIGDKRAMGPRLPDNVWDFPRVVGNSWERRSWHPTQHPQDLLSRIIRYCCHVPSWPTDKQIKDFKIYGIVDREPSMKEFVGSGDMSSDVVLDLFAGSGTSGFVCDKLRVPWIGIEQSKKYVERLYALFGPKLCMSDSPGSSG